MTYQHARYPRLVELLPTVVTEVHRAHVQDPEVGRAAVVEACRVTAALLVKLGEGASPGWRLTGRCPPLLVTGCCWPARRCNWVRCCGHPRGQGR
ncbi:hypothetical protein NKG94_41995 [Micromonospora sp. M12]